ncbi:unnamed protein product [Zymoseptoria tritici ST99CH_1A5]|nr:uncharacterized protein MYCGRDRAFT_107851 [Zymoseptoria tritici IPO323]EGP90745.1 hypothetical protein MYCGRDRAFT_107851 [Zymoseptoria tritici IPO323]SMR45723.1 unnamed protein product [Zymoseptoria tritici ST99CH_1E4]SMY20875.1 unnamed protein product [Zymoseptoria tritici ST99CH_1A5]
MSETGSNASPESGNNDAARAELLRKIGHREKDANPVYQVLESLRRYRFLDTEAEAIESIILAALKPLLAIHEGVCEELGKARGARYTKLSTTPCGRDESLQWKQLITKVGPKTMPAQWEDILYKLRNAAFFELATHAVPLSEALSQAFDDLRARPQYTDTLPEDYNEAKGELSDMTMDVVAAHSRALVQPSIKLGAVLRQLHDRLDKLLSRMGSVQVDINAALNVTSERVQKEYRQSSMEDQTKLLQNLIDVALAADDPMVLSKPQYQAKWAVVIYLPLVGYLEEIDDSIADAEKLQARISSLLDVVVRDEEDSDDDGDDMELIGKSDDEMGHGEERAAENQEDAPRSRRKVMPLKYEDSDGGDPPAAGVPNWEYALPGGDGAAFMALHEHDEDGGGNGTAKQYKPSASRRDLLAWAMNLSEDWCESGNFFDLCSTMLALQDELEKGTLNKGKKATQDTNLLVAETSACLNKIEEYVVFTNSSINDEWVDANVPGPELAALLVKFGFQDG